MALGAPNLYGGLCGTMILRSGTVILEPLGRCGGVQKFISRYACFVGRSKIYGPGKGVLAERALARVRWW
jgi:hypothetical protein